MWLRLDNAGYKFKQLPDATVTYLVKKDGMASSGITALHALRKKHSFFTGKIKLHLGSGTQYIPGWINCDLYAEQVDQRFDVAKIPYPNNSVDEIMAYHIIEHFDFMQGQDVLKEWYRALKPGGRIRLETPDLLGTCKRFVEGTEQYRILLYGHFFAWPWLPGQTHKFLFTETQLFWTLSQIGFKNVQRLLPDSIYYDNGANFADLFLNVEAYK
jgi:predicted SAM-dependent methyltransferase